MDIRALDLETNPYRLAPGTVAALRESGLTDGLWPIDSPTSGRCVLAVTSEGFRIFSVSGGSGRSWKGLHELSVSETLLSFHLGTAADGRNYGLLNPQHADEIATAIRAAGGRVDRVDPTQQPVFMRNDPPEVARLRAEAVDRKASAKDTVIGYAVGGIVLQVIGTFIALAALSSADDVDDTGPAAGVVIGWLMTGLGTLLLFVAIVAYGCRLAIAWRDEDKAASESASRSPRA